MISEKKSGGDGAVDTPVPIPNTEVKHRSGEGIRKDRIASRRAFFLKNIHEKIHFLHNFCFLINPIR